MSTTRRTFLETLGTSAAALGALALPDALSALPAPPDGKWDTSWAQRVTGRHRALFDASTIDSGYGVWRATVWRTQYQEVLGARPAELSAVLVLRAEGIPLAMQQAFWDRYGIGKSRNVLHPLTQQATDRNPALLASSRQEVPPMFDAFALDRFVQAGGIALACDLALQDMARLIAQADGLKEEEAHARARALLVPGVILQPSGVFALVRAQEAGCHFVRAS